MFGAIYTGMSGLTAYSKGLNVISNNIANLNTPGFKGNDLLFQDLFYGYQLSGEFNNNFTKFQFGGGVKADSTTIVYRQGDIHSTGNDTDVAIDGLGFFVLKDGNKSYFTRSGQFTFDKDGYLVMKNLGYRVLAMDEHGKQTYININGYRTVPPTATSEISFTNNLSTGSTKHTLDVNVLDSAGNSHKLTFTFTNNNATEARSWLVDITDESGTAVGTTSEIKFQGNGSPAEGFNTFSFDFTPQNADSMKINVNFGNPDSFTGVTSFSGGTTSDMSVSKVNGNDKGSITSIQFDREGTLQFKYSNGADKTGAKLALANFRDLQALQEIGNALFLARDDNNMTLSVGTKDGLGQIKGGNLEFSNVELTQQFSDLIIVQRGYQASSQILTVSNEMLQQLLQSVSGK